MTNTKYTGLRIVGQSDAEYFRPRSKPVIGSSALKMWIDEPDLYYSIYVAKTMPSPDFGGKGVVGHAVEDAIRTGKMDRWMDAGVATRTAKAVAAMEAEHPDAYVMTSPEYQQATRCTLGALNDPYLRPLIAVADHQVTYEIEEGNVILHARPDMEVPAALLTPEICAALHLGPDTERLLIDFKTTVKLYGKRGFARTSIWDYAYPIQEAHYRHVIARVMGIENLDTLLPFRFFAMCKDTGLARWFDFPDVMGSAESAHAHHLDDLLRRWANDDWSGLCEPLRRELVPDYYKGCKGEEAGDE